MMDRYLAGIGAEIWLAGYHILQHEAKRQRQRIFSVRLSVPKKFGCLAEDKTNIG
jgi:hypothetical protein